MASFERLLRTREGIEDDDREVVAVTRESLPMSMPIRTAVAVFSTSILFQLVHERSKNLLPRPSEGFFVREVRSNVNVHAT